MELFVATGNPHKLLELAPALPGHILRSPDEAGLRGFEVEEDGRTFVDNALKKALTLYRLIGRPSLADDSGLVVGALGGAPGVMSARYGSPDGGVSKLDAAARNRFLLAEMADKEDRTCAFVCCLVLALSEDRLFVVQETCPGELLRESRGSGGFGYDPVVWLPALKKTVAELHVEEKNRISHRGRACTRMYSLIADLEARP
ncbi:MAG: non-canonical purine NTP pyrophosphatase [Rectinemataceae bacterium]